MKCHPVFVIHALTQHISEIYHKRINPDAANTIIRDGNTLLSSVYIGYMKLAEAFRSPEMNLDEYL